MIKLSDLQNRLDVVLVEKESKELLNAHKFEGAYKSPPRDANYYSNELATHNGETYVRPYTEWLCIGNVGIKFVVVNSLERKEKQSSWENYFSQRGGMTTQLFAEWNGRKSKVFSPSGWTLFGNEWIADSIIEE